MENLAWTGSIPPKENKMKRFRRVLVALSVVAAVTAVAAPASADEQQCVEVDLTKYGWGTTNICV